jgi:hypothetical protein
MYEKFRFGDVTTVLAWLLLTLACSPVHAYLGPGGAVSGIGALLALIGAVLLAIIGFVWFPLKRMLSGKRQASEAGDEDDKDDEDSHEEVIPK